MNNRSNYLYELDLQYDSNRLQQELNDLELEPYFKDNPNKDSWFAGPVTWLYADVNESKIVKRNTELESLYIQIKILLGTDNITMAVMRQVANTEVPVHNDKVTQRILDLNGATQIKCAVNIQLGNLVGPINFPALGSLDTYRCALLNVMEDHGVPAFEEDRFFIKFKILDVTYQQAVINYNYNNTMI